MRVDVYGRFLISGECVPVDARWRRLAATWVARTLERITPVPARVSVTLTETLLPDGEIHTRCEIRAWLKDECRLVVDDTGPTPYAALEKNIDRLVASERPPPRP